MISTGAAQYISLSISPNKTKNRADLLKFYISPLPTSLGVKVPKLADIQEIARFLAINAAEVEFIGGS